MPDISHRVVTNKGFSSDTIRTQMRNMGARPAFRPNATRLLCATQTEDADDIYKHRNEVEHLWGRLKEWRVVAARYDKLAQSFMGVLW